MRRIKGIEFDLLVGLASSTIAVIAGYYLFKQPLTTIEITRNFITSAIGSYVIRKLTKRNG